MADTLLDPVDTEHGPLLAYEARVGALESRVQAIEPRPLQVAPALALFTPTNTWEQTTVSASFQTFWIARTPVVSHPACMVRGNVAATVGSTAEMRAVLTGPSGTATSTVRPISSGYNDTDALGWQHGLTLWEPGDCTLELQVRRVSGSGLIYVRFFTMAMIDPRGCTAGGGAWYPGGWMPNW